MSQLNLSRKALTSLAASAALLVAASGAASAKPGPKFGGFGFGPGLVAGSLALGAIAAGSVAVSAEDCYIVRRVLIDDDGNEYVRRVRVCD